MIRVSGLSPIAPRLSPSEESQAQQLCGVWTRTNANGAKFSCWEHCRPAVRGKNYCYAAAREVAGE